MWVSLYELETLLGKEAARLLTIHFGGVRFYVPTTMETGGNIAKIIGERAATLLSEVYGGRSITVPNGKNEPHKQRIIAMLEAGLEKSDIARELEVTERYVYHVAQHAGIGSNIEQLTLPL